MIGLPVDEMIGSNISMVDPFYDDAIRESHWNGLRSGEPVGFKAENFRADGTGFPVDIVSHLIEVDGKEIEVSIVKDISDQIRTEEMLRLANIKLDLMNRVTMHDISNNLSIIGGNLSMIERDADDDMRRHLRSMRAAIASIEKELDFSREYTRLRSERPRWVGMREVAIGSISSLPEGISVSIDLDGISMLDDGMMDKVLLNLVKDSLKHGGDVSSISFSYEAEENDILLIYEDDGAGVDPMIRDSIFQPGIGKDHGYGLFLVSEMLSMKGITIRECGEHGARFEMRIPNTMLRVRMDQ